MENRQKNRAMAPPDKVKPPLDMRLNNQMPGLYYV